MKADISELIEAFPDTRIGVLVATGLQVVETRPEALATEIAATEAAARAAHTRDGVGEMPGVAAWRTAYKGFGVKKTSYRSSVERLLRNVLGDRDLPAINNLVDCYNRVSVAHVMPVGADDLDRVSGDIAFRYARDDDSFIALGQTDEDPPKSGEVVYADATKVLCRRWNWYQDSRSASGPETKRAVLTVQCMGAGDLDAAIHDLADSLTRHCGAQVTWAIADQANPTVELET